MNIYLVQVYDAGKGVHLYGALVLFSSNIWCRLFYIPKSKPNRVISCGYPVHPAYKWVLFLFNLIILTD